MRYNTDDWITHCLNSVKLKLLVFDLYLADEKTIWDEWLLDWKVLGSLTNWFCLNNVSLISVKYFQFGIGHSYDFTYIFFFHFLSLNKVIQIDAHYLLRTAGCMWWRMSAWLIDLAKVWSAIKGFCDIGSMYSHRIP